MNTQRHESALRPLPRTGLAHPHYESARQRQRRLFKAEIRDFLRDADAMRQRLATARVLESVQ